LEQGTVVKSTGKLFRVRTPEGELVDCAIKGKFRERDIKTTNPLAVGDKVTFERLSDREQGQGVITELEGRRNYIIRKSSNLSKEAQVIAANIDQAVLMVTLMNPETPVEFIDRFLVTAEAYSIPAVILFNKSDIYGREEKIRLEYLKQLYEKIGYGTLTISVREKTNADSVISLFRDRISLLAGNSGVGKSSLLNLLNPSLNLKTEEISGYHRQGRHATTYPEMHMMPFGGAVIDTPGIRGFGVIDLEKGETYHFFPEIFRRSSMCRFYNCLHINEPDCAVRSAVESEEIAWSRYRSYLSIMEGDEGKYR
jgi:ribosome biogenesis GTPase